MARGRFAANIQSVPTIERNCHHNGKHALRASDAAVGFDYFLDRPKLVEEQPS